MAFDETLADRIRVVLGPRQDIDEKKMFGGLAFMVDGKMFCGIVGDQLMVRVGPDAYDAALARSHVRPMDFTGRPMNGYVFVEPAGCKTPKSIQPWVKLSLAFVATVERKPKRKSSKPKFPRRPLRR